MHLRLSKPWRKTSSSRRPCSTACRRKARRARPPCVSANARAEKYIFRGLELNPNTWSIPASAKPLQTRFPHKILPQAPIGVPGSAQAAPAPDPGRVVLLYPRARALHARLTVFAAEGCARPFDSYPGDVDIVPKSMAHFTENIGTDGSEFRVLEIFRTPGLEDFSLDP
jgi:hypothetical protein